MKLLIMGPQGSGKGTQAKLIAERHSIPHISTGDIFRENIKGQTELGSKAKEYIDKGQLVPDSLTIELVRDRLAKDDCRQGFILDGFPRTRAQAEALDSLVEIDKVILIDVSDDESVRRISARRSCESCGAVYSTYIEDIDSCKSCGGKLIIRDDDQPETVRQRLEIYHSNADPLISFYQTKGNLEKIDGERTIEMIFSDIEDKLEKK